MHAVHKRLLFAATLMAVVSLPPTPNGAAAKEDTKIQNSQLGDPIAGSREKEFQPEPAPASA